MKIRIFAANHFAIKECSTSTNSLGVDNFARNINTQSIQAETEDSESTKTIVPQVSLPKFQSQQSPPVNSCISSTSSYCIISNLKGVLNTLHDCLPGDSGVYIDNTSYKDVLGILEMILMSCGTAYHTNELSKHSKIIGMNKCNTQPTLKATYEEVPKRMISSSTDCNKFYKKKTRT